MSDEYAERAQQARELLARSSPAAARAMRVRKGEAVRSRRVVEEGRWAWIDWQAQQAIDAQPPLIEASLPEVEVDVEDEAARRRRVALARARTRARMYRQNDKFGSTL